MRIVKNPQAQFGQIDIAAIQIDARSRDDIPALLKGLQYIYSHEAIREQVFKQLESALDSQAYRGVGRPGMELWPQRFRTEIQDSHKLNYRDVVS